MKKAISPLIATVLLIAFAITVAAIIENFTITNVGNTLSTTSEKALPALKCGSGLKIRSASFNGTGSVLKALVTNEDQSTPLQNITFSAIMRDGSTNVYNTTCNCADEVLGPGEPSYYSATAAGGCNITTLVVSSNCPNARDTITSARMDFTGC